MRKGVTVRNRFQHIEWVVVCFNNLFFVTSKIEIDNP